MCSFFEQSHEIQTGTPPSLSQGVLGERITPRDSCYSYVKSQKDRVVEGDDPKYSVGEPRVSIEDYIAILLDDISQTTPFEWSLIFNPYMSEESCTEYIKKFTLRLQEDLKIFSSSDVEQKKIRQQQIFNERNFCFGVYFTF